MEHIILGLAIYLARHAPRQFRERTLQPTVIPLPTVTKGLDVVFIAASYDYAAFLNLK
jgi:hypothetical protein